MSQKWVVGVSGGPDSMALLDKLYKKGYLLYVAHVNYQKRSTSNLDERLVQEYCSQRNIDFTVRYYDEEDRGNFQAKARDFRYAFFNDLVKEHDCKGVAIGHHKNDDLETYLFQEKTQRKTKIAGLLEYTQLDDLMVWRPLLGETKEALIHYCEEENIDYAIDQSNFETDYTRNKIRKELSVLDDNEFNKLYEELETTKREKENYNKQLFYLDNPFMVEDYLEFESHLRYDLLRLWLIKNGHKKYDYSRKFFEEIDRQIKNGKSQILLDDYTLSISYGEVMLHQDLSFSYVIDSISYHETNHYKITKTGEKAQSLHLNEADFPLTIRSYKKDDAIKMRFGTKSVNRFLIDRKIPIHRRKSWLVVENYVKEVIFVAELGCDIRHYSNNSNVFVIKL